MNAPDKIYLQVCGECPEEDCKNCKFEDLEDNITWCKDRIYKKDIEYIRKDALLEWAKSQKAWLKQGYKKEWKNEDTLNGGRLMLDKLIKKLSSM